MSVNLGSFLQRYNLREEDVLHPVKNKHVQKISKCCCSSWRSLPAVLDMENHLIWKDIEREAGDEERRKCRFFSQWQSEKGSDASYKALISALLDLNCQQDAEYICNLLRKTRLTDNADKSAKLAEQNFVRIKGCFASLVRRLSTRLNASNIDVTELRSYVANLFRPGKFIENASSIAEIFNALTHNGLWDYSSCTALDFIFKEFGGKDEELQECVTKYKADLAGFRATTKIIDFIKVVDKIADPHGSISQYKARFDKDYFSELTFKLDEIVTEESLTYIDEFWMSIANLFLIPPLVTLLEQIREGCTEVTWLVPTQAVAKIESIISSIVTFQQAQVTRITLEDKTLYALEKDQEQEKLIHNLQVSIQMKDLMIAKLQKQIDLMQNIQTNEVSHFDFQWEHGANMPIGMDGYIQAVVVQGKVYVGGGETRYEQDEDDDDDDDDEEDTSEIYNYIVMEYDTASGKWDCLVPYESTGFAMTVIYDRLVLVGGLENHTPCTKLGMCVKKDVEWTFPYPDMPTGRFNCSAVVYNQWLIVAGGVGLYSSLVSVDVLNIANQQWHAGPPLPQPWRSMKISVARDICYFIGDGSIDAYQPACCVCMETLIASISSESVNIMDAQVWREIAEPPNNASSPFSFDGHLYSAGGYDETGDAVSAIYQYLPAAETWVKVGDLPSPRYFFTCATLRSSKIVIIGGNDYCYSLQSSIDIAIVNKKLLPIN